MPSASASDQIAWITDLLCPLWHDLQSGVPQCTIMQLDPTSLPVRDKDHGFGIQLGSLCAYVVIKSSSCICMRRRARKNGQRVGEVGPETPCAAERAHDGRRVNAFDKSFLRPDLIELHATCTGGATSSKRSTRRYAGSATAPRRTTIYDIERRSRGLSELERTQLGSTSRSRSMKSCCRGVARI